GRRGQGRVRGKRRVHSRMRGSSLQGEYCIERSAFFPALLECSCSWASRELSKGYPSHVSFATGFLEARGRIYGSCWSQDHCFLSSRRSTACRPFVGRPRCVWWHSAGSTTGCCHVELRL